MPLRSNDIGSLGGGDAPMRQVTAELWIAEAAEGQEGTTLATGRETLRVNVTKAAGEGGTNTALGRALSWIREREGQTIIITGPDAEAIVAAATP